MNRSRTRLAFATWFAASGSQADPDNFLHSSVTRQIRGSWSGQLRSVRRSHFPRTASSCVPPRSPAGSARAEPPRAESRYERSLSDRGGNWTINGDEFKLVKSSESLSGSSVVSLEFSAARRCRLGRGANTKDASPDFSPRFDALRGCRKGGASAPPKSPLPPPCWSCAPRTFRPQAARGTGHRNSHEGLVTAGLKPRPSRPVVRNAG